MSAKFESRNRVAKEHDAHYGTPQPGPSNHSFYGPTDLGSRFQDWMRYADNLALELKDNLKEAIERFKNYKTEENKNWVDICENNLKRFNEHKPVIDSQLGEMIDDGGDGDYLDDAVIKSKALFEKQFRNKSSPNGQTKLSRIPVSKSFSSPSLHGGSNRNQEPFSKKTENLLQGMLRRQASKIGVPAENMLATAIHIKGSQSKIPRHQSNLQAKYAEVAVVATKNPSAISVVTVSALKQGPAGTMMKSVSKTRHIHISDDSRIPTRQISQDEIRAREERSARSETKHEQKRQDRESKIVPSKRLTPEEKQNVQTKRSHLAMENEEKIHEKKAIGKAKRDLYHLKMEIENSHRPASSQLSTRGQSRDDVTLAPLQYSQQSVIEDHTPYINILNFWRDKIDELRARNMNCINTLKFIGDTANANKCLHQMRSLLKDLFVYEKQIQDASKDNDIESLTKIIYGILSTVAKKYECSFLLAGQTRDRVKSVQVSNRPQPHGLRSMSSVNKSMSRHEKKRYEESMAKTKARLAKKKDMVGKPPPGAPVPPPVRSMHDMTAEEKEALRQRKQKRDEDLKKRGAQGLHRRFEAEFMGDLSGYPFSRYINLDRFNNRSEREFLMAPEIRPPTSIIPRKSRPMSAPAPQPTMSNLEQRRYQEAIAKSKARIAKKKQLVGGPRAGAPLPPPVRSVSDMTTGEREALRRRKRLRDDVLKKRGEEGIHRRFKAEMGESASSAIPSPSAINLAKILRQERELYANQELRPPRDMPSRQQRSASAPAPQRAMNALEQKRYEEALAMSKARITKKKELAGKPRSGVPVPPPVRSVRDMTADEREALRQRKQKRDAVLKIRGEEGIHKRFKAEMGESLSTAIPSPSSINLNQILRQERDFYANPELRPHRPIAPRQQRPASAPTLQRTMSALEQRRYEEGVAKAKAKREQKLQQIVRSGVPIPPPTRTINEMTREEKEAIRARKQKLEQQIAEKARLGKRKREPPRSAPVQSRHGSRPASVAAGTALHSAPRLDHLDNEKKYLMSTWYEAISQYRSNSNDLIQKAQNKFSTTRDENAKRWLNECKRKYINFEAKVKEHTQNIKQALIMNDDEILEQAVFEALEIVLDDQYICSEMTEKAAERRSVSSRSQPGIPRPPPVRSVKEMTREEREALKQRKLKLERQIKERADRGIEKRAAIEIPGPALPMIQRISTPRTPPCPQTPSRPQTPFRPQTPRDEQPISETPHRPQRTMSSLQQRRYEEGLARARRLSQMRLNTASSIPAPTPPLTRSTKDMTREEREAIKARREKLNKKIAQMGKIGSRRAQQAAQIGQERLQDRFGAEARTITLPTPKIPKVSKEEVEHLKNKFQQNYSDYLEAHKAVGQLKKTIADLDADHQDSLTSSRARRKIAERVQAEVDVARGLSRAKNELRGVVQSTSRSIGAIPKKSRPSFKRIESQLWKEATRKIEENNKKCLREANMQQDQEWVRICQEKRKRFTKMKAMQEEVILKAMLQNDPNLLKITIDNAIGKLQGDEFVCSKQLDKIEAHIGLQPTDLNESRRYMMATWQDAVNLTRSDNAKMIKHLQDKMILGQDRNIQRWLAECKKRSQNFEKKVKELTTSIQQTLRTSEYEEAEEAVFNALEIILDDRYVCTDVPQKPNATGIREAIQNDHASNRRRLTLLKHQIAKEFKMEKNKSETPFIAKTSEQAPQTTPRATHLGTPRYQTPYRESERKRDWAVRIPPRWIHPTEEQIAELRKRMNMKDVNYYLEWTKKIDASCMSKEAYERHQDWLSKAIKKPFQRYTLQELVLAFPVETQHLRVPPNDPDAEEFVPKPELWHGDFTTPYSPTSDSVPTVRLDNALTEAIQWRLAEDSDSSSLLSFKIENMLNSPTKKARYIAAQKRSLEIGEKEVQRLLTLAKPGVQFKATPRSPRDWMTYTDKDDVIDEGSLSHNERLQNDIRRTANQQEMMLIGSPEEAAEISRLMEDAEQARGRTEPINLYEYPDLLLNGVTDIEPGSFVPLEINTVSLNESFDQTIPDMDISLRGYTNEIPREDLATELLSDESDEIIELPELNYSDLSNDNSIPYNVKLGSATRENFIQLRGSEDPDWFPGYYVSLPSGDGKLEKLESPTDILHRVWDDIKPGVL